MKGGSVETVLQLVADTPLTPVLTVNPESNFVVITYWWGTGNLNKNLQRPCPEDIVEPIREEMEEELAEEDETYAAIYERIGRINRIRRDKKAAGEALNEEEKVEYKAATAAQVAFLRTYFGRQNVKEQLNRRYAQAVERLREAGEFIQPRTFNEMIEEWKQTCVNARCNYLVVEYPIGREDYQNGINAKPSFIRKALDACPGKGVLYVDGDMFVNKYPSIFDLKNVDYMARGWNVDPRTKHTYKTEVCFDPYIFETSGGTMFFGNTDLSRELLDQWAAAMNAPENRGKAEDRVISQILTTKKYSLKANVVQLPIEYLWLTDNYTQIDPLDATQAKAFIEHPACLTGEERASDQGASSDRTPPGYTEQVENLVDCARLGGVFYEFIFFPNREMVSAFEPYLEYLKCAKNFDTEEPLFEVVSFDDKYGRYNSVAYENDRAAREIQIAPPGNVPVDLPATATIPEILANLYAGHDVRLNGAVARRPNSEFVAQNLETDTNHYFARMRLDVTKPMYITHSNLIIQHLLRMCRTLEDINTHLENSYVFVSRIRWYLGEIQGARRRRKTIRRK